MDNYKIKVKDEAESKEAQELLKQLGFKEEGITDIDLPCYLATWDGGYADYYIDSLSEGKKREEITLPQLRDLVVLKRNDVKDANYKLFISPSQGYLSLYKASDDVFYAYAEKSKCWDKSRAVDVNTKDLEPIDIEHASEEKDPSLISGADVPALIKVGEEVQFRSIIIKGYSEWKDLDLERDEEEFSLGDLINTRFEWRLKPQTIKLELELMKPFEPKEGDEYWFINNYDDRKYSNAFFKNDGQDVLFTKFGAWRTEGEIKQVVEQLGKIRGAS